MRHILVFLTVLIASLTCSGINAQAQQKTWRCSAPNLVNSSYDGGGSAYIHLGSFSSGGHYPVTKDKTGTTATGTTANGTKFTCKAS